MKTTLNILHHQDNDWKRELDFYVGELAILTKRLEEISIKKPAKDIPEQAEQFLNKFVKIREKIESLSDEIKTRESNVERKAIDNPEQMDEEIRVLNDKLLARFGSLSGSIASTRFEFNQFLSKVFTK